MMPYTNFIPNFVRVDRRHQITRQSLCICNEGNGIGRSLAFRRTVSVSHLLACALRWMTADRTKAPGHRCAGVTIVRVTVARLNRQLQSANKQLQAFSG
jgi:hypothetical protein